MIDSSAIGGEMQSCTRASAAALYLTQL